MRDYDLTTIFIALNLPGMFHGPNKVVQEEQVNMFLYAYNLGSQNECRFKDLLIDHLFKKYSVFPSPAGLMHQIKSIAETKSVDWFELFATEGKEVLREVSDGDGKNRFVKILRKQIAALLKNGPDPQSYDWGIVSWNHVVRQVEKWPGVNLNADEMAMLLSITEAWSKCFGLEVNQVPVDLKNDIALLKELVERNLSLS